jgi:hypothetical protein
MDVVDSEVVVVADQCDSCGARAYVRVTMKASGLDLCFCSHHWVAHRQALLTQVSNVVDLTGELEEQSALF